MNDICIEILEAIFANK
jgi:hypothetical protein